MGTSIGSNVCSSEVYLSSALVSLSVLTSVANVLIARPERGDVTLEEVHARSLVGFKVLGDCSLDANNEDLSFDDEGDERLVASVWFAGDAGLRLAGDRRVQDVELGESRPQGERLADDFEGDFKEGEENLGDNLSDAFSMVRSARGDR